MAIYRLAVWNEVDEFLMSQPTPQQIIDFHASPEIAERIALLLENNREGTLTAEERIELDEVLSVEKFIRRLKAKALRRVSE
jgi:hypothetical protein